MLCSINNGLNDTNTDNANMWRTTPDTGNTFSSMVGTAMLNDINSKAYTLGASCNHVLPLHRAPNTLHDGAVRLL